MKSLKSYEDILSGEAIAEHSLNRLHDENKELSHINNGLSKLPEIHRQLKKTIFPEKHARSKVVLI